MPTPLKPCDGFFSQDTINLLTANRDHAQWLLHPCGRCGQQVGARIDKGRWSPESHWRSIPPRARRDKATNRRPVSDVVAQSRPMEHDRELAER